MDEKQKPSPSTLSDPATWVTEHGDYLYRYALKRLRNQATAEDMVQETLMAALNAREQFAGQSNERTWLVAILKHKIIDYFRKHAREVETDSEIIAQTVAEDDFHASGPSEGLWKKERRPLDWIIDPSDAAEQREFWKYLTLCLDGVEPRLSTAFVLREIEQLDSKEVCNTLDISATNLRVMLHRVRKHLRHCLEKKWMGGSRS